MTTRRPRAAAAARRTVGHRPLTLPRVWRRALRRVGPGVLVALVTALSTAFVIGSPRGAHTAYDRSLGDTVGTGTARHA